MPDTNKAKEQLLKLIEKEKKAKYSFDASSILDEFDKLNNPTATTKKEPENKYVIKNSDVEQPKTDKFYNEELSPSLITPTAPKELTGYEVPDSIDLKAAEERQKQKQGWGVIEEGTLSQDFVNVRNQKPDYNPALDDKLSTIEDIDVQIRNIEAAQNKIAKTVPYRDYANMYDADTWDKDRYNTLADTKDMLLQGRKLNDFLENRPKDNDKQKELIESTGKSIDATPILYTGGSMSSGSVRELAKQGTHLASNPEQYWYDLKKGFTSPLAKDFFSLGINEISRNFNLLDIAQRSNADPNSITSEESKALEAYKTLEMLKQGTELPFTYEVAKGVVDMIPYMAQFALTDGVGTATSKAVSSFLGKKIGLNLLGNTFIKGGTKLFSRIASAGTQSVLMPNLENKFAQERLGQFNVSLNDEGNVVAKEKEDAASVFESTIKSLAVNFNEVLFERGAFSQLGANALFKGTANRFSNVFKNPVYKEMTAKLAKVTGYNGPLGEYLEEWETGFANAAIGEGKFSDLFDGRQQSQTFLTCLIVGKAFKAVEKIEQGVTYADMYNETRKSKNTIVNSNFGKGVISAMQLETVDQRFQTLKNLNWQGQDDATIKKSIDYIRTKIEFDVFKGFESNNKLQKNVANIENQVNAISNKKTGYIDILSDKQNNIYHVLDGDPEAADFNGMLTVMQPDGQIGTLGYQDSFHDIHRMSKESVMSSRMQDIETQAEYDDVMQEEQENAETAEIITTANVQEETNEGITPEQSLNGTRVILPDGTIGEISHPINGDGNIGVYRLDEDGEVISNSEKYLPTELKLYNEEDYEEDETITDGTQNPDVSTQTNQINGQNKPEGQNTGNGSVNNVSNPNTNTQVIPVNAKGEIDYKAITDANVFAQAIVQEFGEDSQDILDGYIEDATQELTNIGKIKDRAERKRTERKLNAKLAIYEQVNAILNPSTPAQQPIAPANNVSTPANTEAPVVSTEAKPLQNVTSTEAELPPPPADMMNDNNGNLVPFVPESAPLTNEASKTEDAVSDDVKDAETNSANETANLQTKPASEKMTEPVSSSDVDVQEITPEEQAELNKEFAAFKKAQEKEEHIPDKAIEDVAPEEIPPMPDPEDIQGMIDWISRYSTNGHDILAAHTMELGNIPYNYLLEWQRAFVEGGFQTTKASFIQFNDKNNIGGTLARAFFKKGKGIPLDQIALAITAEGQDPVSEQEIALFMIALSRPKHGLLRRTTDTQKMLEKRFKDVTGFSIKNKKAWLKTTQNKEVAENTEDIPEDLIEVINLSSVKFNINDIHSIEDLINFVQAEKDRSFMGMDDMYDSVIDYLKTTNHEYEFIKRRIAEAIGQEINTNESKGNGGQDEQRPEYTGTPEAGLRGRGSDTPPEQIPERNDEIKSFEQRIAEHDAKIKAAQQEWKDAEEEYNKSNKRIKEQIDIFGKADAEEMLFKNDIGEQQQIVSDAKKTMDNTASNLNKLIKQRESIQPDNQLDVEKEGEKAEKDRVPVIGIGDLHGENPETFKQDLIKAGVIDSNLNWITDRTVIQIGDVTDRGQHSEELIDFLNELQNKSNGKLIRILGNHDLAHIQGKAADLKGIPNEMITAKLRDAIDNNRIVAAWSEGDTIYTHAGIDINTFDFYVGLTPSEIVNSLNEKLKYAVKRNNYNDEIFKNNGIFWKRGDIENNQFRQVVGHTVKSKEHTYKNGDRVKYIDTGRIFGGSNELFNNTISGEVFAGEVFAGDVLNEITTPTSKDNLQVEIKSEIGLINESLLPEQEQIILTEPLSETAEDVETPVKIEDFGEKIEGARKDQIKKYFDQINLNGNILSVIFPKPDIKGLLESGLSPKDVAGIKVAYEFAVHDKKKGERIIKFYASYAKNILAESINIEFNNNGLVFTPHGKSQIELRTKAYEDVYDKLGADYLALDLTKVDIRETDKSGNTTYFNNGEPVKDVNYIVRYYVNATKYFTELEDAINYFTEQVKINTKTDEVIYKRKLNIYYNKNVKGEFYIGYPSKGDVIKLKEGFKTSKEGFEMLKNPEMHADLQTMLERILAENRQKSKPSVRLKYNNETARERVGKDWRNGKNIGSKELAETFGFKAIEFGNWVNQKERQVFVNNTYDSLMDLAQLLNISPKSISLGGKLGITFGSRGSGKAAAHYEPERIIINLTKTQGLGSLAHEWWHAMDNYFADFKVKSTNMMASSSMEYSPDARNEIKNAFDNLYKTVNNSQYKKRAKNLDETRKANYFALPHEMSARAFENYILNRLAQSGQVNDFIVNYVSNEDWNGEANKYPYPVADESVSINQTFQNLFDTIEEKEDEAGNTVMFRKVSPIGFFSTVENALDAIKQDKGTPEQFKAMLLKNGAKQAELDWMGWDDHFPDVTKKVTKADIQDFIDSNNIDKDEAHYNNVKATADEYGKKLGVKVHTVRTRLNLPKRIQKLMNEDSTYSGVYDQSTDTVYIVAHEVTNIEDVVKTLIHEIVSHKGLRNLLGNKFDSVMEMIYDHMTQEQRKAIIKEYGFSPTNHVRIADEFTAFMSEKGNIPSWFGSVISKIRDLIRNTLGINLKMNDGDIVYLLWKSKNKFEKEATAGQVLEYIVRESDVKANIAKGNNGDFNPDDPNIKFRKQTRTNDPEMGYRAITPWTKDDIQRNIQDKALPLKLVQQELTGKSGIGLDYRNDVYDAMNKYKAGAAKQFVYFQREQMTPLMNVIKDIAQKHNKDSEQVSDYLLAKSSVELQDIFEGKSGIAKDIEDLEYSKTGKSYTERKAINIKIKALTQQLGGEKQGVRAFSDNPDAKWNREVCEHIIDEFESSVAPDMIDKLWLRTNNATHYSLTYLLNAGFLKLDEYNKMIAQRKFYVPLRGWNFEDETNPLDYFNFVSSTENDDSFDNPMMKAKGRSSKPSNPLTHIAAMGESAIIYGSKNMMIQKVLELLRQHQERKDVAILKRAWKVYNEDTGEWEETYDPPQHLLDERKRIRAEVKILEKAKVGKTKDERKLITKQIVDLEAEINIKDTVNRTNQKSLPKKQADLRDVVVYERGIKFVISFKDPEIANVLNGRSNLNVVWQGVAYGLEKSLGKPTRWLSANFTSKSPDFIAPNFIRDYMFANASHFINGDKMVASFNKHIANGDAFGAIHRFVNKTENYSNNIDKEFRTYLEEGGATGFTQLKTQEQLLREITTEIFGKKGWRKLTGDAAKYTGIHHLGKFLEYTAVQSELMCRFATYLAAKENGKNTSEAVSLAKNITTNFDRKGEIAQIFGPTYSFFNAGIQGITIPLQMAYKHPIRFAATCFSFVVFGFVNSMLLSMTKGDDDDDYPTDWEIANNAMFRTPSGWVKIPLPHFFRSLWAVGANASRVIKGETEAKKAAYNIVDGLMNAFSPVNFMAGFNEASEGKAPLRPVVPTFLVPFYDIITNTDFKNDPVFREMYTLAIEEYTPDSEKGLKNTNKGVYAVTKWLNELGGGDEKLPAGFDRTGRERKEWKTIYDWNPAKLEHFAEYMLGGRGKFVNNVFKTIYNGATGQEINPYNIPIANRFYSKSRSEKNFYPKYKEVVQHIADYNHYLSQAKGDLKKGDIANFMNLVSDNEMYLMKIKKDIMDKKIDAINLQLDYSKDEEQTKALNKQKQEYMKELIEDWEKTVKEK